MSEMQGLQRVRFLFDKYAREPFYEDPYTQEIMIPYPGNIVGEGDVIGQVIEFDEENFMQDPDLDDAPSDPNSMATEHVMYNAKSKEFIAKLYGFIILKDKKLSIIPLVRFSEDNLSCYLYVHTTLGKKFPSLAEIKKSFDILKLIHVVDDYHINYELDQLNKDPKKGGGAVKIGEGVPPVEGIVEMIELRKSSEHRVGKELEDGRIDYKEKDVFDTVKKGDLIAERIPEVPPKEGVDVFGNTIAGELTGESPYRLGKNLEPQEEGSNLLVASTDGVLDISEDRKINVEERLIVSGDVDMNTGHVRFPGIIEITGNIKPGFEVEANKDVFVHGNIEDSLIIAGGNVRVDNGILGKEHCKVIAKGDVHSRFVQNAEILSDKSIYIQESMVQGICFAREHIKVDGRIVGGELYGLLGIESVIAGAASGTKTILVAGKDPELEEKIDALNVKITETLNALKENIDEITQYFGENILTEVKTVIKTLPPHRQKQLLTLVKKIKDINAVASELKKERDELKKNLIFPEPPKIVVKEESFVGVTIRIKNAVKKLDEKIPHRAKFYEDPKTKIIAWES